MNEAVGFGILNSTTTNNHNTKLMMTAMKTANQTLDNVCAYARIIGENINYYMQTLEIYCGR